LVQTGHPGPENQAADDYESYRFRGTVSLRSNIPLWNSIRCPHRFVITNKVIGAPVRENPPVKRAWTTSSHPNTENLKNEEEDPPHQGLGTAWKVIRFFSKTAH